MEGLCLKPRSKLVALAPDYAGQVYTYSELYKWIMSEYDRPYMTCTDVPIKQYVDSHGDIVFEMINGWRVSEAARKALTSHKPIAILKG